MIRVKGILYDPIGNPTIETPILIKSITTNDYNIAGNLSKIYTKDDGSYDFNLNNGIYEIKVLYDNKYEILNDTLVVDGSTPSQLTLNELVRQ